MNKKKNKKSYLYLIIAAFLTFFSFGSFPHDQFRPLFTIASLLPLQFAALIWVYLNGYLRDFDKNF